MLTITAVGVIWRGVLNLVLCDNVFFFFQLLVSGHRYRPGTPVYSTNTTYRHNIADILLKLALSIHNLNPLLY
jgi:hypothetical protein